MNWAFQGWRTLKSWALQPTAVANWVVRKTEEEERAPKLKAHTVTHMPFTTPFNHRDTRAAHNHPPPTPPSTTSLPGKPGYHS